MMEDDDGSGAGEELEDANERGDPSPVRLCLKRLRWGGGLKAAVSKSATSYCRT